MELLAKAYLLLLNLLLLATAINNSSEQESIMNGIAIVTVMLAVIAVLVVW